MGPWRITLRCASLVWLLVLWTRKWCTRSQLVTSTALLLFLMLLPELLLLSGGPALAAPVEEQIQLLLDVQGAVPSSPRPRLAIIHLVNKVK